MVVEGLQKGFVNATKTLNHYGNTGFLATESATSPVGGYEGSMATWAEADNEIENMQNSWWARALGNPNKVLFGIMAVVGLFLFMPLIEGYIGADS